MCALYSDTPVQIIGAILSMQIALRMVILVYIRLTIIILVHYITLSAHNVS